MIVFFGHKKVVNSDDNYILQYLKSNWQILSKPEMVYYKIKLKYIMIVGISKSLWYGLWNKVFPSPVKPSSPPILMLF